MIESLQSGRWELPGGGVEVHETLPEGAARECFEETGYRVVAVGPDPLHVAVLTRDAGAKGAGGTTAIRIGWKSGAWTELRVRRPATADHARTPAAVLERLRAGAQRLPDERLAAALNAEGLTTRQGAPGRRRASSACAPTTGSPPRARRCRRPGRPAGTASCRPAPPPPSWAWHLSPVSPAEGASPAAATSPTME
jgi:ADP-ribose pyrophosphatase YjhB (NUDIX family)